MKKRAVKDAMKCLEIVRREMFEIASINAPIGADEREDYEILIMIRDALFDLRNNNYYNPDLLSQYDIDYIVRVENYLSLREQNQLLLIEASESVISNVLEDYIPTPLTINNDTLIPVATAINNPINFIARAVDNIAHFLWWLVPHDTTRIIPINEDITAIITPEEVAIDPAYQILVTPLVGIDNSI